MRKLKQKGVIFSRILPRTASNGQSIVEWNISRGIADSVNASTGNTGSGREGQRTARQRKR